MSKQMSSLETRVSVSRCMFSCCALGIGKNSNKQVWLTKLDVLVCAFSLYHSDIANSTSPLIHQAIYMPTTSPELELHFGLEIFPKCVAQNVKTEYIIG